MKLLCVRYCGISQRMAECWRALPLLLAPPPGCLQRECGNECSPFRVGNKYHRRTPALILRYMLKTSLAPPPCSYEIRFASRFDALYGTLQHDLTELTLGRRPRSLERLIQGFIRAESRLPSLGGVPGYNHADDSSSAPLSQVNRYAAGSLQGF